MDIKKSIEDLALKRGRAVAKADPIYNSADEARTAESSATSAKNPKDFEKLKKECLTSAEAGEKAVKPWQKEIEDWDAGIKNLEKEIAAEKDKIAQQQKEADAVNKAIDDINADIKKYNDSLLLGEHDPRHRPLVLKKSSLAKLLFASAALAEAAGLAKSERTTWSNQKDWVAKPIDELKTIKGRVSKAKFKASK
jgi:septal ring factor EnvC (AmiA/AmiB activator)